jgi:class 3 adenylate cyclase
MREESDSRLRQLAMFVTELCCDLCRFHHVAVDGLRPEEVRIRRELSLSQGSFADILVQPAHLPSYYVEVKYGYPTERVVNHLVRKFGRGTERVHDAASLILVVDTERRSEWHTAVTRIRADIREDLKFEVWDENQLRGFLADTFDVDVQAIDDANAHEIRAAIDSAKWRYAFGGDHPESHVQSTLLWHLGFWKLRELYEARKVPPWEILSPGRYPKTLVLLADLASFSSYVRDTADGNVMRDCLTAFYSSGMHVVHSCGGMLYQFIGDELVAMFGIPERSERYVEKALECAEALIEIGESVSNQWQRQIDRIQPSSGVHMGMAIGDIHTVAQRPFSQSHIGAVGDVINMAARLMNAAGPGELVVSNTVREAMSERHRSRFAECEALDAKNVGRIKSWRMSFAAS